MKYETLVKKLARYEQVTNADTTLYLRNGKVVATQKKNVLVMYFQCSPDVIWNHNNIVAVAVAKKFVIVKNYEKIVADVVVVDGLCGACTSIKRTTNRLLEHDWESEILIFKKDLKYFSKDLNDRTFLIGAIGYTEERGIFKFYDDSIMITVPPHMCDFSFDQLNYCILKKKMGRRTKKKPKYICPQHYDVYQYLREEQDWYWTHGFETCGSAETRAQIRKTQSTNFHKLSKATICIK